MKADDYFPLDRSDGLSSQWVRDIDRKRTWKEGHGRTALLVLDMQNFFLDPNGHAFLPASITALDRIQDLLKCFKGPVIFTCHRNSMIDTDNLMTIWWKDVIDGKWSEITSDLDTSIGPVIEKEHYSAFHGTELETILRSDEVDSVLISGVMTDLCCETTARDAFMRGFKVIFLADCTATENERRHLSTLNVIAKAFGEVMTSKEYLSL